MPVGRPAISRAAAAAAALGALGALGAAPALGAQTLSAPAPRDPVAAVGCWTVRADGTGLSDGAQAIGLPAQLRLDVGGDAVAVRDGMQRRATWTAAGNGALRVALLLPSGGTATLELTPAEGEWYGQVRAADHGDARRWRTPVRVTLVRGTGCPRR